MLEEVLVLRGLHLGVPGVSGLPPLLLLLLLTPLKLLAPSPSVVDGLAFLPSPSGPRGKGRGASPPNPTKCGNGRARPRRIPRSGRQASPKSLVGNWGTVARRIPPESRVPRQKVGKGLVLANLTAGPCRHIPSGAANSMHEPPVAFFLSYLFFFYVF